MDKYSQEEIIGMCEAYELYEMLPNEYRQKLPKEFVEDMIECSKAGLGAKIDSVDDIDANKLSTEGIKRIAYMCLFFK